MQRLMSSPWLANAHFYSTVVGPLATLTGDVGKGLLKRNLIGYDELLTPPCVCSQIHGVSKHAHRGVDNIANSSCDWKLQVAHTVGVDVNVHDFCLSMWPCVELAT